MASRWRASTHVLGAALLALSAGCSSAPPLQVQTLPFHVAVVPMVDAAVGSVAPGELPGEATELRLDLACEAVTGSVSAALEEYCFSRVTVLDPSLADGASELDAFAREKRLVELATEVGADLLIELDLRYDSEIYRDTSSSFWLNFPLFLFAGPSHWFLGDNEYYADVELTTTVYDMNVMEAGAFALGDPAARVLSASARYAGSDLTFTERSDGLGDYVLGIFVPSGYLSRESDSALSETHAHVLEDLRGQVVQGIQGRRGDLVRAEWIAPVFLDPGEVQLLRDGDEVVVHGQVRLRRGQLVERIQSVALQAGGERVLVRPVSDPGASSAGYEVLPFVARVPVGAGAEHVRIECIAGSRDRYVRSYTFKLPEDRRAERLEP